MRSDFNKLLTERERYNSKEKFRTSRHVKDGRDPEVGGRQGIKRAHRGGPRKQFSENLNPLKGYLKTRVGKSWDKTYSEIRKNFDARKVINNHILEHLFDYVEIHVSIVDGKPVTLNQYSRYDERQYIPIKETFSDYYVDPRDGVMKETGYDKNKRIVEAKKAQKIKESLAKIKRVIDKDNELHLLDGVWYLVTIKDNPPPIRKIEPPRTPYVDHLTAAREAREWAALTPAQQEKQGRVVFENVYPETARLNDDSYESTGKYDPVANSRFFLPRGRYHASKITASKDVLRKHGLIGTAAGTTVQQMSHREAAAYR